MRITVDIHPELLHQAVAATGEKNRSKALAKALREFLRNSRLDALHKAPGRITLDDHWLELEETELDAYNDRH